MFRVLCVDDNHDVADSEAMLLRATGFDARACYDRASALALADAFRPAVCLIDLHMPGMDGDVLAALLRTWANATGRLVYLVAVTAMDNEASRHRIECVFDLHLIKPVDPHQLLALLDELTSTPIHQA